MYEYELVSWKGFASRNLTKIKLQFCSVRYSSTDVLFINIPKVHFTSNIFSSNFK